MGRRSSWRVAAATVAVGVLLTASACSDDKDNASSGTTAGAATTSAAATTATSAATTATTGASATTAASDPLGSPKAATGSPVKIGWVNAEGGTTGLDYPEQRESMQAAVDYANAYLGGLRGHKIEIDRCDDKEDGVSAPACANQFVDDDVLAVVQGQVSNGATYVNTLSPAGIPWIAYTGISVEEYTGTNVYLWNSGVLGQLAGVAAYAQQKGWKRVAIVGVNVAGVTAVANNFAKPIFAAAGVQLDVALITPGTPDPTTEVLAGLTSNPQGVIVYADATTCRGVMPVLANNATPDGTKVTTFITTTCIDPSVLETVPPEDFNGVQIPAYRGPTGDDSETKLYEAIMAKYAPSTPVTGQSSGGYATMLAFIRMVNAGGLPEGAVTTADIGTAIKAAKGVPLPLGLGTQMTCDGKAVPAFKSICSTGVVSATLKDAKPEGFELIDASKVLSSAFGGGA
jgi:branched-chain amino acid transport system substrate-binding protein